MSKSNSQGSNIATNQQLINQSNNNYTWKVKSTAFKNSDNDGGKKHLYFDTKNNKLIEIDADYGFKKQDVLSLSSDKSMASNYKLDGKHKINITTNEGEMIFENLSKSKKSSLTLILGKKLQ
ncbi:hypothetical protein [Apilactobacillus quenuiae]|uniref:hypothetical protein n=1 Tax=Apilactobacillus quenuiae TaxID=2008377 RepID=UPI0012FFDBE9|nr:hypothetical protein [Apilactobacillus quenuiae]